MLIFQYTNIIVNQTNFLSKHHLTIYLVMDYFELLLQVNSSIQMNAILKINDVFASYIQLYFSLEKLHPIQQNNNLLLLQHCQINHLVKVTNLI